MRSGCDDFHFRRNRRFRNQRRPQLLASYAGLRAARVRGHAQTQMAVSRLIELYVSWGKPEKADPYRALPHANPDKSKK